MVKVRRHWQDNSGSRVSTGRWAARIDGVCYPTMTGSRRGDGDEEHRGSTQPLSRRRGNGLVARASKRRRHVARPPRDWTRRLGWST